MFFPVQAIAHPTQLYVMAAVSGFCWEFLDFATSAPEDL